MDLAPGLNVFVGRNAQGKTSLLEGIGLLARGRSFRTEDTRSLVRRGATSLSAWGHTESPDRQIRLEVELKEAQKTFRVDGRPVAPRAYHGRLEVLVYSTDRLKVIRGPMRERRQFLDRSASIIWPAYRQALRDYERVLLQRNAALQTRHRDLVDWDQQFVELGAQLRQRRRDYLTKVSTALRTHVRQIPDAYDIVMDLDGLDPQDADGREALRSEMERRRGEELRVGRSLVGPHRDPVSIRVNGHDAAETASSGQARGALLALTLAALEVYREMRGDPPVALLDDFDSELDEERATAICEDIAGRGQAFVTTAHAGWARRLGAIGRTFQVAEGQVVAA